MFSTGTVLGLYYLVNLRLGSVLQAESDDGLLDQIRKWFGKRFCMLQYESCFFTRLCHLSVLQLLFELPAIQTRRRRKTGNAAINDAVFAFI